MASIRGIETVARQARLTDDAAGRPWPLPDGPWSQAQTRRDLRLASWPAALDELARLLPPELAVDTFDGEAWLSVAAFRVTSLRARGLPPLPGLSSFPQVEVATPVSFGGEGGLWLFSLDVPSLLLVEAARRLHRLPAYRSRIQLSGGTGGTVDASRDGLAYRARFAADAGAAALDPEPVAPGTLEHFLTERYAVYTADGGRLYRAELHHGPVRVQTATADVEAATLAPVALAGEPRALLVAEQDLLVWPLEEL